MTATPIKIAVLDDFQNVVAKLADWAATKVTE